MNMRMKKLSIPALGAVALALTMAACKDKPGSPGGQAEPGDEEVRYFTDPVADCSSTRAPSEIKDEYWHGQFQRVNAEVAAAKDCKLVFFGDSITKDWTMLRQSGKAVWDERFAKYNPINMGNSGDITPVMLYRCRKGNLDFAKGEEPLVAVLLCGTNNYVVTKSAKGAVEWELGIDTPPDEVAEGVRAVAQMFWKELPMTRLIVLGILPVKNAEKQPKVAETNEILAGFECLEDEIVFMDLKDHFMNEDGTLKEGLYTDGTHLTTMGYEVMADAIGPEIERLMKLGPIPQN